MKTEKCQCHACECDDDATTTDDSGIPVCDACALYTVTDQGNVVCGRMDVGVVCHVCHDTIDWGMIQTGHVGNNYETGRCSCDGHVWINRNPDGRGDYSYEIESGK